MGPQITGLKLQGAFGTNIIKNDAKLSDKPIETVKMTNGTAAADTIADIHNISNRAAEQNLENQGFPPGLAKFMKQDMAFMPPKPGALSLVQNNIRSAFSEKIDPKDEFKMYSSYQTGDEAEQAA